MQPDSLSVVLRAERLLTPDVVHSPGWVHVERGRIVEVGAGEPAMPAEDLGAATIAPGFVDLHCHGGGGHSFADGPADAMTVVAAHRRHGTTSTMASLATDTLDSLERQIQALSPLVAGDELLGVHLEGPWLSDLHCGAHDPALLRDPVPEDVDRLLGASPGMVGMVTLAAERPGGLAAIGRVVEAGAAAALGHSDATYGLAHAAVDAGVRVGTHLFNAARPVHHREPGLVLALLERSEVLVELIADGAHLHPSVLREAALRKAQRGSGGFALVTDAMAAAAAGDGRYRLGRREVEVTGGVARLVGSETLAGSTLTLDAAVRHTVEGAGIALADAIRAVTVSPAQVLGRHDIGRLAPGAHADLVVLDRHLRVRQVMRRGSWIDEATDG